MADGAAGALAQPMMQLSLQPAYPQTVMVVLSTEVLFNQLGGVLSLVRAQQQPVVVPRAVVGELRALQPDDRATSALLTLDALEKSGERWIRFQQAHEHVDVAAGCAGEIAATRYCAAHGHALPPSLPAVLGCCRYFCSLPNFASLPAPVVIATLATASDTMASIARMWIDSDPTLARMRAVPLALH